METMVKFERDIYNGTIGTSVTDPLEPNDPIPVN